MRAIRVGMRRRGVGLLEMQRMWGISVGMRGMGVGMQGIRVGLRVYKYLIGILQGYCQIRYPSLCS